MEPATAHRHDRVLGTRRRRRGRPPWCNAVLDPDRLIAQAPHIGRDLFAPAFALPDLAGKPVRLDDYGAKSRSQLLGILVRSRAARVPHMRSCTRTSAAIVHIAAISDDVSDTKMRAFVTEFRPPFRFCGSRPMKGVITIGVALLVLLDKQEHHRAHLRVGARRSSASCAKHSRNPC